MKRQLSLVALLAALAACVFSLTGAAWAAKDTTASTALSPIPITGTFTGPGSATGTITGTFTPRRFTADPSGQLVLAGVLSGTASTSNGKANKHFNQVPVQLPVSLAGSTDSSSQSSTQSGTTSRNTSARAAAVTGATCPILNLVLGPLNLNLLGLQITLNQVNLNINAIPGAGALLGNLLCDVANLLNTPNLPTSALADLLNGILGLLGTL